MKRPTKMQQQMIAIEAKEMHVDSLVANLENVLTDDYTLQIGERGFNWPIIRFIDNDTRAVTEIGGIDWETTANDVLESFIETL